MGSAFAQTTKNIMTVEDKDGVKTVYRVDNVERVSFSTKTFNTLKNQWELNDKAQNIASVTLQETDDANVFAIYGEAKAETKEVGNAEPKMVLTMPTMEVTMPKAHMGNTVSLAEEGVKVALYGKEVALKGTLKIKFDKFQKNVIISLDAMLGNDDLRCEYNSAFTKVYTATQEITVTPTKGDAYTGNIASAFIVNPKNVGEATNFAFGDVKATKPVDLLGGKYAAWISVSASKLYNGSIDMVSDASSYTIHFIDYATRTVYTTVKSGTITTAKDSEGYTYVKINATLPDGIAFNVEYLGKPAEAESLDEIIPKAVEENQYKYYNSDGEIAKTVKIGTSYISEGTKTVKFYLVKDGATSKKDEEQVYIEVEPSLIGAGELSLPEITLEKKYSIRYTVGGIQLDSHKKTGGYGNEPNNGTLSITKNEDGSYDIYLEVTNKYTNNYTSDGGDNTKIVLHYVGTFEKY